jgi:AraC family transcriptional regulator of adaptative response / DNA-3-methyladenine glycosylase II
MPTPDDARLYRALVARDARFDGVFFVGVTSTRVYCRPVCRAPRPRPEHCRFFVSAAAAERRGFRPCLRCRPELAPGTTPADGTPADDAAASVDAVRRLAHRAAARIAAGALDRGGLAALADELGVTTRHLRRAVGRELGATPVALAQTRRLLTAKQLLTDTDLAVTHVALASGFGSVRRFNALFHARYRLAPGALRRRGGRAGGDVPAERPDVVTLSLAYRPPLDWPAMLAYLATRATPGVEAVDSAGARYARSVSLDGCHGFVVVAPSTPGRGRGAPSHTLRLDVSTTLLPALVPLLARLRRLLDLDADPEAIAAHLGADPRLAALVARRPGLRVPGSLDGFELAWRAVLGQQVSVRGATTLAGRLTRLLGEPLGEPLGESLAASAPSDAPAPAGLPALLTHRPVTAARLADAGAPLVASIGLPRARAECLVTLARAVTDGGFPELVGDAAGASPTSCMRRLRALPGVGAWTASYVAMRALRWPDAFPDGDLALRRALGGLTPARLRDAAERWRPWRAYAAQHLWASLGDVREPVPPTGDAR